MFLSYTLADFAAKLNIVYPKGCADDESTNDMDNNLPCNELMKIMIDLLFYCIVQMVSFLKNVRKLE